ncbi:MAG TPA: SPOR domain-containing protein [Steroidobacteraceae bacterium]|nr:SPOR domain-containing protein [Steroidobacteraceae bacterium]
MKKSFLVLCVISAGALVACSSPNADWQKANQQNSVAAYQQFIQQHPNDARVEQARNRINALKDEQAWATAQSANTLDGYQQYLQQEPNGMHAADAQDKVTGLQQDAAWQTAQSTNTAAGYQDFLTKYPNAPTADQAREALKKLTGYQVRLASVRSKTAADKLAQHLKDKFGSDLQDVVVVPPSGKSKSSEIRSAPMTESDAKAACAKLKKAHQHCEVVKSVS